MTTRFEIGKIYTARSYNGGDSEYIVINRNDETHRITIQSFIKGRPFGNKMSRKIRTASETESITVVASTFGGVCWSGGITMDACNEVI